MPEQITPLSILYLLSCTQWRSKWSRSKWSFSISDAVIWLTIYKYKIFIIVADFDNQKTILTKMTMTIVTTLCDSEPQKFAP